MKSQEKSARIIFATNLKKARLKQNLSQEALAALVGLHRTYIGSVERGERNISIDNMERIAKTLGHELRDMLTEGDS